jgi:opacity protein-like surface antigen
MKKLALTFVSFCALLPLAYAGPEAFSGKEMKQVIPPPCPEWYADNEWNVNVFGTYVFTDNNWADDTYLEADHAYGGGIDVKYFFHRYFGVGIEAWGVSANRRSRELVEDENSLFEPEPLFESSNGPHDSRIVGAVLATFTFRYPIHCSRFSPYVFTGGGVIFGGGESARFIDDDFGIDNDRTVVSDSDTKGIIQLGGGLEVRITRHIGITNDFSYNVIDGQKNNFGMSRAGLNFAF